MFVCSVRASTLRFVGVAVLCAVLLFGTLILSDGRLVAAASGTSVSYTGADTDAGRIDFLEKQGWTVKREVVDEATFTLPEEFDRVMQGYNEIQKTQGLDLSRYRKKKVTRYTYEVTNYPDYEGTVYANLIVYRGRIIAADLSSADPLGFVSGVIPTT